jgi:hypothetical protein
MIKDITEKEYRSLPKNSSSSLKDYSTDRRKYYKRHILKEKVAEKYNAAIVMGQLVETILMEPDEFDNLFFMSSCVNIPGATMGNFINALVKYTLKATDADTGLVATPFLDLAELAYTDSGYKIKLEAVIKKFVGTDNEIYYNELIKTKFNNLTVITPQDVNNAEQIVKELKNNPITSTIVNLESGPRFTVINQMKISGFDIDGLELKSMLDKVIVDNDDKTIQFYDLKCTWSVENFYKDYYLYRRSYIQAFVYYEALLSLTTGKKDSIYFGYTVLLPKFIVCDSINYNSPLIYELTGKDMHLANIGFEVKGYRYPGVKEIIENLTWSLFHDTWNISKTNYENNGLVSLVPIH